MAAPPLNSGTMRPSNATDDRPVVGFAFPFRKEGGEFPKRVRDADCVKNNVFTLFKTPKRSRIMRPRVGTNAYDIIFETQGVLLATRLDRGVRQTLASGEPRAKPLKVIVSDDGTLTNVRVVYEVQGVREAVDLDPFAKG